MGHTRYYSYLCDVDQCHTVTVTAWVEDINIPAPNELPPGWTTIQERPGRKQYVCLNCTSSERFGKLM